MVNQYITIEEFSEKYGISLPKLKRQASTRKWREEKIFIPLRFNKNQRKKYSYIIWQSDIKRYFNLNSQFENSQTAAAYQKTAENIPVYEQWTNTSATCFHNNLNCSICPNWDVICCRIAEFSPNKKPPIKVVALQLFSKLGKPPKELTETEIA